MVNAADLDQLDLVGDIQAGRPELGNQINLAVYRLMIYSLRSVMVGEMGRLTADTMFYNAGRLAGRALHEGLLSGMEFENDSDFIRRLQELWLKLKIGRLEVIEASKDRSRYLFEVFEDIDCSGLPDTGEVRCQLDEGLIGELLRRQFGGQYITREVSCWGTGGRSCRFESVRVESE